MFRTAKARRKNRSNPCALTVKGFDLLTLNLTYRKSSRDCGFKQRIRCATTCEGEGRIIFLPREGCLQDRDKTIFKMRTRLILFLGITVALVLLWDARGRALPLGIHTLRVDDSELQQIRDLGAQYVVQVFSWREIEPSPGEFHWEYTDWLLRAAEFYDLRVVARLDKTPGWAASNPSAFNALPARVDDYADFAARVAARYRGRIAAYIIWNEPNLAREWGDQTPDPNAYATLLKLAALRIRAADPSARIVSAGLAPTNERSERAMDDRDYMRALYAAGARDAFDILAAHPYASANPPDDPRGAHDGLNFYRILDLREIMVANGDATKPIWITEFGYTTDPPSEFAHLRVSEGEQARFIPRAYAIAREQMPFVEMFGVWNLTREVPPTDEQSGYSLIRADGSPKPAYAAIRAMQKESLAVKFAASAASSFSAHPAQSKFTILARDAIVHLGDSEYPLPWLPLYRTKNPSIDWTGEFYLSTADLMNTPSGKPWLLTLELMQVSDLDNRVLVNDQPVEPPNLPTEDFTSIWVTAQFQVPAQVLRVGRNTVTLRIGKLFPAFQQFGFTWDDLQVRNVVLRVP